MVSSAGGSSDPVDPLDGYSSLSLFPLSLNLHLSSVDDPNPNFPTADSLHPHLKAMVLRSPEKLLKQAKTILDDSLDLFKTDKTSAMASEDKTEAIFAANQKDPQEKRPALGLKRAKFSAKPMPRQPPVMFEPSIDIDKLNDPEDFFAAIERMENANKELQKLRGQPLKDLDQNLSSLPPRSRRPSLLGKSATYKHHSYSSKAMDDNSETLLSSQETFDHHILSPVRQDVPSETDAVNILPNARVSDSTSTDTRKVNELDELLSCDYEGLDEAGVLNLLQDKLDIRLKDIGKTSLPDLRDVRPRKSVSAGEALSKVKDTISRLNGMRKAIGDKPLAVRGQSKERAVQTQISPARSKSPLASISLLNRHISKLRPSEDPFSALDIESSPDKSSPKTHHGTQSDLGDARMELYERQRSLVHREEGTAVSSPPVSAVNGIASSSQPKEWLDKVNQCDQAGTMKDLHEFEKSSAHAEEINAVCGGMSPSLVVKNIAAAYEPRERVDSVSKSDQVGRREDLFELVRSPAQIDERVADPCEESVVFAVRDVDPTSKNKEWDDQVTEDEGFVQQEINIEGSDLEKSTVNEAEGCRLGEASNEEDIGTEEPTKETRRSTKRKLELVKKSNAPSQASLEETVNGMKATTLSNSPRLKETGNKRSKVGVPLGSRKKKELRRQSLWEVGTKLEGGVRRSTRIRMRPLEYWKGERFLYGRVHDSLVTVIGVKYASPSKEAGEPAIKVKSFVSDEYKEQVDRAALY